MKERGVRGKYESGGVRATANRRSKRHPHEAVATDNALGPALR
jgi:hypothetical protein